mmetsp:Transcript_13026/g.52510  ORF Transcript_13026/g.52510 Transcript_13026/m.52510 type:complete len:211 (+) Transcript_13026:817-1449(+)
MGRRLRPARVGHGVRAHGAARRAQVGRGRRPVRVRAGRGRRRGVVVQGTDPERFLGQLDGDVKRGAPRVRRRRGPNRRGERGRSGHERGRRRRRRGFGIRTGSLRGRRFVSPRAEGVLSRGRGAEGGARGDAASSRGRSIARRVRRLAGARVGRGAGDGGGVGARRRGAVRGRGYAAFTPRVGGQRGESRGRTERKNERKKGTPGVPKGV